MFIHQEVAKETNYAKRRKTWYKLSGQNYIVGQTPL